MLAFLEHQKYSFSNDYQRGQDNEQQLSIKTNKIEGKIVLVERQTIKSVDKQVAISFHDFLKTIINKFNFRKYKFQ